MACTADRIRSDPKAARRPPGFLLSPFGWAAEPLAAMAQAEPRLLAHLFEIGRPRMHMIALALAHLDREVPPEFGLLLARGSRRVILDRTVGHQVIGIGRALDHLPAEVLSQDGYRQLVAILDDPKTAKILYHAYEINNTTIRVLYALPKSLCRPVAVSLIGWDCKLDGFADGLRFLVAAGAAPSFDALVCDLAAVTHPGQFIAKIKRLVEALPLPKTSPPATVGHGRRLDRIAEVRALGKDWQNCLATFMSQINEGKSAVYLWDDGHVFAACLVKRHGRLGWFLAQVKGPRNADIEPVQLEVIRTSFANAGVPQARVISGIETIVEGADDDWVAVPGT
jgi:hypothetical protein